MTREIKFRGKRLDNGEWVFGNLIIAENGAPYIFPPEICEIDGHHLRQGDDTPHWVDPDTIGEYTGLKDKNGREIYEGDIMNWGNRKCRIGYIGYSEVHPAFMFVTRHVDFVLYSRNSERQYEVLGNIHDNPELLTRGHNE